MTKQIRLLVCGLCAGCLLAGTPALAAQGDVQVPKVGDTVPAWKGESVEGMAISSRPPAGRLLLISVWSTSGSSADDVAKRGVVLFRRFHAKGLDALGICVDSSEDRVLQFAEKWNLPWPLLLDIGDEKPTRRLGVSGWPFNMLVDSSGKVVAVNLEGEGAHATIARLLGVDLSKLPMPPEPEPRKVKKVIVNPDEERDLVSDNPRVYVAATPLAPDRVELVWSAWGLPAGAGRWQNNYVVFVAPQQELFAPYRAEVQVSHAIKRGFRRIAEVPAESQRYVWTASVPGKLLWYRVVFRDAQGRVAAISDLAPAVTGPNLILNGDFERPVDKPVAYAASDKDISWFQTPLAERLPKLNDALSKAEVRILEESRPFSAGKRCLAAGSLEDTLVLGTVPVPANPEKSYLVGAWIRVSNGKATFGRLSLDDQQRPLAVSKVIVEKTGRRWMFCAQRLSFDKTMKPKAGEAATVGRDQAAGMPGNQAFLRPHVLIEGQTAIDDTFLVEYAEADEEVLKALPKPEEIKADDAASDGFKRRRAASVGPTSEAE